MWENGNSKYKSPWLWDTSQFRDTKNQKRLCFRIYKIVLKSETMCPYYINLLNYGALNFIS